MNDEKKFRDDLFPNGKPTPEEFIKKIVELIEAQNQ